MWPCSTSRRRDWDMANSWGQSSAVPGSLLASALFLANAKSALETACKAQHDQQNDLQVPAKSLTFSTVHGAVLKTISERLLPLR